MDEQTPEICLEAARQNKKALNCIRDPELSKTIRKQLMERSSIGNSNKIDISSKNPAPSSKDSKELHHTKTIFNR